MSVIVSADVGDFFRTEVNHARKHLGIDLCDMTEYYVVNLLCEYSKSSNAIMPGDEPLALVYKRALESVAADRIRLFKNLGDMALYVSGFFTDSIERSAVDVDYYISMGGNAYTTLSDIMGNKSQGDTFSDLYRQLACKFTEIVDLLGEISDRAAGMHEDDQTLLKLYDRWARTGSQRIRKLLIEKGITPDAHINTDYIQ